MDLILRPVSFDQGVYYTSHTKVDASLRGILLGETGVHVSSNTSKVHKLLKNYLVAEMAE